MFIRSIIVLIFGLLAPLSLSSPLDAQIIYGTILDAESEIGVPDVEVVIIGPDGSSHGKVVTDSLGVFRAVLPLPDHYSIARSKEHTSELQSRRQLVCRLLLANT